MHGFPKQHASRLGLPRYFAVSRMRCMSYGIGFAHLTARGATTAEAGPKAAATNIASVICAVPMANVRNAVYEDIWDLF